MIQGVRVQVRRGRRVKGEKGRVTGFRSAIHFTVSSSPFALVLSLNPEP
jgi:hypothetical protein